jgi:hypothetical protein
MSVSHAHRRKMQADRQQRKERKAARAMAESVETGLHRADYTEVLPDVFSKKSAVLLENTFVLFGRHIRGGTVGVVLSRLCH